MKKITALFLISFIFISRGYCQDLSSASQPVQSSPSSGEYNYTGFSRNEVKITRELDSLTSSEFKSHPEYGVLPFNAPCTDCIELLQKRDESHRYFVKNGSKGREIYQQTSYGNMSFKEDGVLRTVDTRITPTVQPGVFKANHQPFPVTINIPEKFTSLLNEGKELQVNRNVNIYIKHSDGSVTSLGEPDWSNYTAGDNGVLVHNFYPGIDLEMRAGNGNIESFYRLNKPLNLGDGWLVIHDNMKLPQGLVYDYSHSEKMDNNYYEGSLYINNEAGTHFFFIGAPSAYDEKGGEDNTVNLNYQIADNGAYDLYVPTNWMNDAKRSYPLVIDPTVTATSSMPPTGINSGYSATCGPWTNGCSYTLAVNVPAGFTFTDLTTTFWFRAFNPCTLSSGAWDLTYKGCRFLNSSGQEQGCDIPIPGLCQLTNLSAYTDLKACLPPPSCSASVDSLVLTFYRCTQPGAGCGPSCIIADIVTPTPWSVTVTGTIVEVTTQNDTICQGSSAQLTATADSGLAPYTYKWYPGGIVGQTISVSPATTTTYTVTAMTCGGVDANDSATATSTVTVYQNDNPGFTINPIPACVGVPVTITGNPSNPAGAPGANYNWVTPGGNPANVNGQQSFNVTYANPGNENIILNWTSWANPTSACVFPDTIQLTVIQGSPPAVTISVPSTSICFGDNSTFTANPVNQGLTPDYDWYVDGIMVLSGAATTFSDSTLKNGDNIYVVLNASGVICGSSTDTSNVITMTVNPLLTPGVVITAVPNDTLCPGAPVTFTATPTNGGATPGYNWLVNNNPPVPPASGSTWTTNSSNFQNGDQVTVVMTSDVPCPVPSTATSDTLTIQIFPVVTVNTSGDTTICPGQPSSICAVAAGGDGGPYNYSWDNGGGIGNCVTVSPSIVGANVYTVSATDKCNNPATGPVTQVTITVAQEASPNFTYSPSDISILTPTVHFIDQSTNGTPVSWDFGDSACGNNTALAITNPTHTYCQPGTYTVKLVEVNASGCLDSITYTLEIHDEYYYYIPNSFSPNGDGINDYFAPQGTDALGVLPLVYTMIIYNRWGEKIFETDNTSLPWDGRANNGSKIAEAGVYVYRIQFQNSNYSDKVLVGSVTLVR